MGDWDYYGDIPNAANISLKEGLKVSNEDMNEHSSNLQKRCDLTRSPVVLSSLVVDQGMT